MKLIFTSCTSKMKSQAKIENNKHQIRLTGEQIIQKKLDEVNMLLKDADFSIIQKLRK